MLVFKSIGDVESANGSAPDDLIAAATLCMADIVSRHRNLLSGYVPEEHGFLVAFDRARPPTPAQLRGAGMPADLSDPFALTVEEAEDLGDLWAVTSVVTQEFSMTFLVPKGAAWLPARLREEIEDAAGPGSPPAGANDRRPGGAP